MLSGVLFEVLMAVRAHLFKIDGRVLGGMQFGLLVQVVFWCTQGGMQFGVLLVVLSDTVCGELVEVFGHAGDGAGACLHLDGRVQGGMQLRWWFGILFGCSSG